MVQYFSSTISSLNGSHVGSIMDTLRVGIIQYILKSRIRICHIIFMY